MEPSGNLFSNPEIHLDPEDSVEYTRALLTALNIRLKASAQVEQPLSLHERLAWLDLTKVIDLNALGDGAEAFDAIVSSLIRDSRLQARIELGRVANLDT